MGTPLLPHSMSHDFDNEQSSHIRLMYTFEHLLYHDHHMGWSIATPDQSMICTTNWNLLMWTIEEIIHVVLCISVATIFSC